MKNKLLEACVGLQSHKYAPELNTLHFKNGTRYRCGWSISQNYNYTVENSIDLMLDKLTVGEIDQYVK